MPTPKKESQVEDIKSRLSRSSIAIATGYQGMSASNMTDLRARLREQGIEYRVIKNTLALRAASELGNEGVDRRPAGPNRHRIWVRGRNRDGQGPERLHHHQPSPPGHSWGR